MSDFDFSKPTPLRAAVKKNFSKSIPLKINTPISDPTKLATRSVMLRQEIDCMLLRTTDVLTHLSATRQTNLSRRIGERIKSQTTALFGRALNETFAYELNIYWLTICTHATANLSTFYLSSNRKRKIPAAIETLRDSFSPFIGISAIMSACLKSALEIPFGSLPRIMSAGFFNFIFL
jgi:hypothetical protein